jgi:hypothetical protein
MHRLVIWSDPDTIRQIAQFRVRVLGFAQQEWKSKDPHTLWVSVLVPDEGRDDGLPKGPTMAWAPS